MTALPIGGVSTIYWLQRTSSISSFVRPSIIELSIVFLSVFTHYLFRWLRWRLVMRRQGTFSKLRPELQLYIVSLLSILTPFYLGEWIRNSKALQHVPGRNRKAFAVYMADRIPDGFALLAIAASLRIGAWAGILFGTNWMVSMYGVLSYALHKSEKHHGVGNGRLGLLAYYVGATVVMGTASLLSFYILIRNFVPTITRDTAISIWAEGTLLGPAIGVPAGIATSGSYMISRLIPATGHPGDAIWGVALYRGIGIWCPVVLGTICFIYVLKKNRESNSTDVSEHFDQIAAVYDAQIPEYTRVKVLNAKLRHMRPLLPSAEGTRPGVVKGLDIGCGQGWYMAALSAYGYSMAGVDPSKEQIQAARSNLGDQGDTLVQVASAVSLPFDENSFDFVYSVNVFHHILDPDERKEAFLEVVRVLKPGGHFFLHEINVTNPLFRLYMSYLFPLLNDIDEGNEMWINPRALPATPGGKWIKPVHYFTWLPDFLPRSISTYLEPVEKRLEYSTLHSFSAHFMAVLEKE
ncbi:MAG: methyltransferase domain-containing protein [Kiritimatiellae bacterium]|nr:methyltransferase domain-containing protein [Kiritimatiellia bacterium]